MHFVTKFLEKKVIREDEKHNLTLLVCAWTGFERTTNYFPIHRGFGGLVVSMLASGTQDRGFEPGRSRRIFRAKKSTAACPMSQICGM
jgi:hypothetical protein